MTRFEKTDHHILNMSGMLTRRGVDPTEFVREAPMVAARAIMTCQQCAAGKVCRDWLARAGLLPKRVAVRGCDVVDRN